MTEYSLIQRIKRDWGLLIALCCLTIWSASAQQLSIKLGETTIAANESFKISVVANNTRLTSCGEFPEIPGFKKARGNARSQVTNIVNGQMNTSETIDQNYIPTGKGKFKIPPFTMTVNGQQVKCKGGTVEVGEPIQANRRSRVFDPFADIFGGYGYNTPPPAEDEKLSDAPDGAFLSVATNKNEVYVGEGFNLTVTFLKPFEERDKYAFDVSISEQVMNLQKELKPSSCWEENNPITRLNEERVMINGKLYIGYKLYQTTFFPFSSGVITFPSIDLEMKKYTFTGRRTLFGRAVSEDMKMFHSTPKSIRVKELPPHPLKNQVNVGVYELIEDLDAKSFQTGKSFNYGFAISGKGNVSSISEPYVRKTDSLVIYQPPNTRQQVNKGNGVVYGTKTFEYFVEPLEAGEYEMKDRFQWVFFNPETEVYDTLMPEQKFRVTGESKRDAKVASADLGVYYNGIAEAPNDLRPRNGTAWPKWFTNFSAIGIVMGIGYVVWRKRQEEEE